MQEQFKPFVQVAIIAALVSASVAGLWYAQAFARDKSSLRTFSVTGEAKRIAIPDIARFTAGVTAEGEKDLTSLQKSVNEKMGAIVKYLKDEGVEEKDIKTVQYDVSPKYSYPVCRYDYASSYSSPGDQICPPAKIVGYSVSQKVKVTIRDFEKISEVLGGVVEHGANDVSSLAFELENPEVLRNEARAEAIEKARQQAKSMAKAGRFRIGGLENVIDNVSKYDTYGYERMSASSSSVEPGTQEVSVSVTLRYQIR